MTYVVNELFETWQGEGVHMGEHAFFIRLVGCDQSCHFCDSAQTWHKDYLDKSVNKKMTASEIADEIELFHGQIIVITGGEPALWNLEPLCEELNERFPGKALHIETAGHHEIKGGWRFDWITLSPKPFASKPLVSMLHKANELKIIVEGEESIEYLNSIERVVGQVVWLHPEWSKRNSPEVLSIINREVKINKHKPRAGYQLHKLYNVDKLDTRSDKRFIPLGGVNG